MGLFTLDEILLGAEVVDATAVVGIDVVATTVEVEEQVVVVVTVTERNFLSSPKISPAKWRDLVSGTSWAEEPTNLLSKRNRFKSICGKLSGLT